MESHNTRAAARLLVAAMLASAALLPIFAHAQGSPAATAAKAAGAAEMTEAEVRKVDKENRKITLKHGPIKNLDMPGMTMAFQVRDNAFLDKFKQGDKVRFTAAKSAGKLTITDIQPLK